MTIMCDGRIPEFISVILLTCSETRMEFRNVITKSPMAMYM